MSRHLRTYLSFILIAFSSLLHAQEVQEAEAPVRPGTILLSAFQTVSAAEKLEKEENFKEAWQKYQQALRYYQSLAAAHPAWKPHIVHGRIESTTQAIKRIEPAAQKAFLEEQQNLLNFVDSSSTPTAPNTTATPARPTAAPSTSPSDLEQLTTLTSRINSQQRELDALKKKNEAEKAQMRKQLSNLRNELRKQQQGLGTESTQTRMLNEQIARLQGELRKSQQLGKEDQQKLLTTLEELQRTRTRLATAPLRSDVEKLQKAKSSLEKELKLITSAYSNESKLLKIKTLESQKFKADLKLTKSLLEQKTKDLETSQNNSKAVLNKMREEINTLNQKLSEAETIIASQNTEIATLKTRLSESEALSNELRNDLANMTTERDQLSEMLKLSDADRAKALMKENLRLGQELTTAKRNLAILNKDKNAALDRVKEAENDLAIAKHQLIQKRQENAEFRKRTTSLERSLKATEELLTKASSNPQIDDNAREENEELKKALKRLMAQTTRRREAERMLWQEYQRSAPRNEEFEKEYIDLAGEDIQLTERERAMLLEHQSDTVLNSRRLTSDRATQAIAQAEAQKEIETYHNIGRRLVEKGNLEFAKDIYDEGYDSIPDYSFLINRGVIRMRLGELEDAESIFEIGIAQRPNSPYTHFMLGMSRYHQKHDDLAAKSIDRAIDLQPDYKEAFLYRGIIEERNGRENQALEFFQDAVELDPEYELAHFNLAVLHQIMKNKDKAIASYNNALRAGLAPNAGFEKTLGIKKLSE